MRGELLIVTLRFLRRPDQYLTDEGLRFLGYQHGNGVRHVAGLEHLAGFFANAARAEVGVDRAGTDDAYSDILPTEFLGNAIAEPVQSPFRRGIGGAAWQRVLASERRDVDDVARAGRRHQRHNGAQHEIYATEIGVEDGVPIGGRKLVQQARRAADTRIVHQGVHAAVVAPQVLGERLDAGKVGDVTDNAVAAMALLDQFAGNLLHTGFVAASEDHGSAHLR